MIQGASVPVKNVFFDSECIHNVVYEMYNNIW